MAKEFKTHKMYSKDRIVKIAKTMKEHMELKEKGFNHDSTRDSSPTKFAPILGMIAKKVIVDKVSEKM